MSIWSLRFESFRPQEEGLREALCALGNGSFVTRGAAADAKADGIHYPGTYVAGCYDRLRSQVAGRAVENEDLVNLPNWLPLSFRPAGASRLSPATTEILRYRQALHLRRGTLEREVRHRDLAGRISTVTERRFVSMDDPHLAGTETVFSPENWSGRLIVQSSLDGDVENAGVARYRTLRGDHLVPLRAERVDRETVLLQVRTGQSRIGIAEAARTRLWLNDQPVRDSRRLIRGSRSVGEAIALDVAAGDTVRVEKVVSLHTSRDLAISEEGTEARQRVARAGGFDQTLERHARAWDRLWDRFDISIEGSRRARLILHLHMFHLLQTVSSNTIDLDVGVPARGLHGEAYRGHVFWDELFILPVIDQRLPELTESLLAYRHRRLDEARLAAEHEGHRGAMYPWQSASSGREETQTLHLNPKSGRWLPDNSPLQRHIDIAIAYNVWHHFEVTGDIRFLAMRGAPMILEISRFLASLATPRDGGNRFDIRGVMGPDEYHDAYPGRSTPGLDNNAYTNVMAAWTLARALELMAVLPDHDRRDVRSRLELTDRELSQWATISRRLFVPFHRDGIISQFEGYEDLEEFDWTAYIERYGNIQRLDRILEAEGLSPNRYKVSKQADVLMLFYLLPPDELQGLFQRLGYAFDPQTDIIRNIDYYLARTSNGSTLSRIVHAWVLARYDRRRSSEQFRLGLESDIQDVQGGTTAEGIHLGAMAGTLDLVQRCYGGVHIQQDQVVIRPSLPEGIRGIHFPIYYRSRRLDARITSDRVRIKRDKGGSGLVTVRIGDETFELGQGDEVDRPLALVQPGW